VKTSLRVVFAALVLLAGGATANAQNYGGIGGIPFGQTYRPRPAVSPYLNLLRGGATLESNYYNLVRPENEFRSSIQQLQLQATANQEAITSVQSAGPLVTGHLSSFQTQRSYFQTFTGGQIGTPLGSGAPGVTGTAPSSNRPSGTIAPPRK
jgi:hypothetical protein